MIGATNRLGERPIRRQVGPWDLIATIYRHLGIETKEATVPHPTGRPVLILPEGEPIRELVATA